MEVGGHGPPPIPAGKGKEHLIMDPEPFRLVNLDAAVFDWLWRLVEAKYNQHNGHHVEAAEVAKRAVIAFREAAGTMIEEPKPRRRRLVKVPKTR